MASARSTPPRGRRRAWPLALLALVIVVVGMSTLITWLNLRGDGHDAGPSILLRPGPAQPAELIERGRSLALLGNCAGCHTTPGAPDYSGGPPLHTPFGTVHGGNLTPAPETGLGRWTSQDFWRALHNGRSRDGRLLNPAFPYENFSLISREDSDALYAYLQTRPAVEQPSPPARLRFPANTQWGLAVWRALYFRPAEPITAQRVVPHSALARGEALTRGLAHCSACHASRNALGAQTSTADFKGQLMPQGRAYAPPLPPQGRADAGPWTVDDLVDYLKTGHSRQGAALGLMAEVVSTSTQHVLQEDLRDMATWILSRPRAYPARPPQARAAASAWPDGEGPSDTALGRRVYSDHCARCHGDHGQGVPGIYPPLSGNPRIWQDPPTNLIRVILEGGFGPATAGHPQPFGMPPFGPVLTPEEVAAVATFIRRQSNDAASEVRPLDVLKLR